MNSFDLKKLIIETREGKNLEIGRSAGNRPIQLQRFGDGEIPLLMMAGVHGDEYEGIDLMERYVKYLEDHFNQKRVMLWVIPCLNPDGKENNTRWNDNHVDLNRNLPTKDWSPLAATPRYQPGPSPNSEPENQILTGLLETLKPIFVMSAHSYKYPMINTNGDCDLFANAMRSSNDLVIKPDIGYPTPGSLGTYTGWERNIPTITLEVPQYGDLDVIWEKNRGALNNLLKVAAQNF